jgi:phosphoglycolate phosphatase
MAPRPTIAFDLDGTLVDTAPDLLAALNVVLRETGLAPLPDEHVRGLLGGGARMMIERGLAHHGMRVEDSDIDRMQSRFLEHYQDHIADSSQPFPGAAAMLDVMAAQNANLIVVTNKYERYSIQLLKALGLASRFSVIAGPDTYGVRKPDPGHLLRAVEQAGGDSMATVMVGDSITDVSTARAAKVPVIAVSFGYRDGSVESLGADWVVHHLNEVPDAAARLLR